MAPVTMEISKKPDDEDRPEVKHAREVDALREQCDKCKLYRPSTPTKDCDVRRKLVKEDSEIAWKHKHLFMHSNGHCKMFKIKETKKL